MVLGNKENLYTSSHVVADSTLYFATLVRLSPGVKYDVAGISISSLLIFYIIISGDHSQHFAKDPSVDLLSSMLHSLVFFHYNCS